MCWLCSVSSAARPSPASAAIECGAEFYAIRVREEAEAEEGGGEKEGGQFSDRPLFNRTRRGLAEHSRTVSSVGPAGSSSIRVRAKGGGSKLTRRKRRIGAVPPKTALHFCTIPGVKCRPSRPR